MESHSSTPPVIKFEQYKSSRTIHSINELEHLYSSTSFNHKQSNEQTTTPIFEIEESSPKRELGDLVPEQRNSKSTSHNQQRYRQLNNEQVQHLVAPHNKKWLDGLRRLFEVLLCRG